MDIEPTISDVILVSFDNISGDEPILIVGRKRMNKSVEIVNAFLGDDAKQLYSKLTTVLPKEVDINGE